MKKLLVIPIIILLALGVLWFLAYRGDGSSDAEQITALIERGRQSIEQKSVNVALSCVSKSYSDSLGQNKTKLGNNLGGVFRSQEKMECAVEAPEVEVNGYSATARSHVEIFSVTGASRDSIFTGDVVVKLSKEETRRFFIFPVREWKITRLDGATQIPMSDFTENLP